MSFHVPQYPIETRRRWMATLAKTPRTVLEEAWGDLADRPAYRLVDERHAVPPENSPAALCCVVDLDDTGVRGSASIVDRDRRRAELAAAFDALLLQGDPEAKAVIARLSAAETV